MTIDPTRLATRLEWYALHHGVSNVMFSNMLAMLQSPLGKAIVCTPQDIQDSYLINDAYKMKMHRLYSTYMTGVTVEFALHVRKIPTPLSDILSTYPELQGDMQRGMATISATPPLDGPHLQDVLLRYFNGFNVPEAMSKRAERYGVAPIRLEEAAGQLRAFAQGPAESASHVETSMMQLVQQVQIQAQLLTLQRLQATDQQQRPTHPTTSSQDLSAALQHTPAASTSQRHVNDASSHEEQPQLQTQEIREIRDHKGLSPEEDGQGVEAGCLLDATELLANSLACLCLTVERINQLPHNFQIALYAGRRSSSRLFLLLQNLFCARHLRGWVGTSSVYAAAVTDRLLGEMGVSAGERPGQGLGRLVGTLAHEVVSITQQLMGSYDEKAGGEEGAVCVSALLAHLLLLAASGGLSGATALCDTFTTPSFLAVSCAADIPEEFREDMRRLHREVVPPGGCCFDIFRVWRMDSGNYADVAPLVVAAWQGRCREAALSGEPPPPRPSLMHSNLGSVEEIAEVAQLPEDIRPKTLGFGSLADGFLPFDLPGGQQGSISMCSVVMKAVQARAEKLGPPQQEAAVKLGDGNLSKAQVDPRMPVASRELLLQRVADMAGRTQGLDRKRISAALAEAYHAVTRLGVLQES